MIHKKFQWKFKDLFFLYLYLGFLVIAFATLPNNIWDVTQSKFVIFLGVVAIWRYSWWFLHLIRAMIYRLVIFPHRRRKADRLWESGWRPKYLYFMITTYNEERDIIEACVKSILDAIYEIGVPAKLFVGSAEQENEKVIANFVDNYPNPIDMQTTIIRQNQSGKRCAIGTALRSMSRAHIDSDDPVVFMDGDSILAEGCLKKCVPFFALYKKMHALTTCEQIIMKGPQYMRSLLELRFAQRHMMMQSYAVSNKILCLTGRMSVFRVKNVVKKEFIRTIEADHLYHWLWGNFRFLSGDDKSSWYYLLSQGYDLYYVPDAIVYTIDDFSTKIWSRFRADMMRWSGNILRNGTRAIALGPKRLGWFVWWCLIDQRIAIWTMLIAPVGAIATSLLVNAHFIIVYVIWVLFIRLILSLFLFYYLQRIDMAFPVLLYFVQFSNSVVKIYMTFRLSQQGWFHRGNQKAGGQGLKYYHLRRYMALYLTTLSIILFILVILIYLKLVPDPF